MIKDGVAMPTMDASTCWIAASAALGGGGTSSSP